MIEKKEYVAKRTSGGFKKVLFVDRGRGGLFRIYARVAGTRRAYYGIKRSFMTEAGAQEFLNLYAVTKNLTRSYRLDR